MNGKFIETHNVEYGIQHCDSLNFSFIHSFILHNLCKMETFPIVIDRKHSSFFFSSDYWSEKIGDLMKTRYVGISHLNGLASPCSDLNGLREHIFVYEGVVCSAAS